MTGIAKIIEVIGTSENGWSEAAQAALDETKKTINGITGLEILDQSQHRPLSARFILRILEVYAMRLRII